MAHLVKCWCGKRYRCETDHEKENAGKLMAIGFVIHDECPDYIFHWEPSDGWLEEIRKNG